MDPERWNRLKELFGEAIGRDGAERAALIERSCTGDPELRSELESLLAAGDGAGRFLEASAAEVLLRDLAEPGRSPVGRRLGPYRVVSEIGHGGMGVVFRAVRDDDAYHKEVAVKLLHFDLDSRYFEERFRRERQILASLDHPNIARLLDGGADEAGRPYLVLELVEGTHIDVYCGQHHLNLPARLELIRSACGAVSLAHSRLVVHCDLKPANVLVTADGTVKLLDFGIAKLLSPDTSGPFPQATATGWWMTPQYASPEQVRGAPVTTATDVYSLGVLLYELLTGRRPYDLGSRSPDEIVRAICDQEVARPSHALARTLPDDPDERRKHASPAGPPDANTRRLRRRLKGDLDTIVQRALAKDPARRYASVVQLSDDLRRYLRGLPIRARPDRAGYRLRKFVGRNRAAVAASLLVVASLCGGIVATLRQARLAHAERLIAERRFDEVRSLASTFIFEIHDAVAALPGSTPVRKRIVELGLQYLERLELEAGDDASLQAELAAAYERIASVQGGVGVANLGDVEGAAASQRRALALRQSVVRSAPEDVGALLALATAHARMGDLVGAAGDREARVQHYALADEVLSAAAERAPSDVAVRRAIASSAWNQAQLRVDDGDLEAGLDAFENVLGLYERMAEADGATDADRRNLALASKKVGAIRSAIGEPERALESLTTALTIDEERLAVDPNRPETVLDVAFDHGDLGYVLLQLGRPGDAVAHYERSVELRESVSKADPEDVRARSVLHSGRVRLAGALTELVAQGQLACAAALPHAERAMALWSEAEAAGPLDEDVKAQRDRLQAIMAPCSKASGPP